MDIFINLIIFVLFTIGAILFLWNSGPFRG